MPDELPTRRHPVADGVQFPFTGGGGVWDNSGAPRCGETEKTGHERTYRAQAHRRRGRLLRKVLMRRAGAVAPGRRTLLVPGLASALLVAIAVVFAVAYLRGRRTLDITQVQPGTTASFEGKRHMLLPDGSRIELQGGSMQVRDVGPARARAVLHRGQAMFRVVSLPARRYGLTVEAGAYEVLVTGTVFGVETREGGRVSVNVVQGEVGIRPKGAAASVWRVHAGERWSSDVNDPPRTPVQGH